MPDARNGSPVSTVPSSVLVRSDQDSGMALIKSNDGRTKWLTVSADPSSPSFSWDDRVRNWASKLGVCAVASQDQGTPLPTPPPRDPRSQQDKDQDWVPSSTSSSPSSSPAAERNTNPPSAPAAPAAASEQQVRMRGTRRAGSFARGFLLGLGGGGSSTAKRDSGIEDADGVDSVGKGKGKRKASAKEPHAAAAAAAAAAVTMKVNTNVDSNFLGNQVAAVATQAQGSEKEEGEERAAETAAVVSELSGRQRWVKGAPPSPVEASKACDWSCSSSHSSDSHDGHSGNRADDGSRLDARDCTGRIYKSTEDTILDADTSRTKSPEARRLQVDKAPALATGATSTDSRCETGDDGDDWLDAGMTLSSKASKNKRKKGKAKAKSKAKRVSCTPTATATTKATPSEKERTPAGSAKTKLAENRAKSLNMSFGYVHMLEFTRDVGGCGVPSEGTWGLALGLPFRETIVDVDGYEHSKVEILETRAEDLPKKQRALSTGETRQFDYRPVGERNPLFGRLGEKDRSKVLLDYACFHKEDLKEADSKHNHHNDNEGTSTSATARGTALDGSDLSVYSHKISHSEFVDKSQEVSPALKALRDSRRGSQGCTCACVRADKLNVARLREELNKRGLKMSGSKKDLTKALQEAMRAEEEKDGGRSHKVCRSEDCQCVRDGVECHADLCNCCKGPNMGKKDAHHGGLCGNPEGVYAFSSSAVKSYRHPFVTAKHTPGRDRKYSRSDSMCSDHH